MEVVTGPNDIHEETLCRLMAQYKNDLMRMCAACRMRRWRRMLCRKRF